MSRFLSIWHVEGEIQKENQLVRMYERLYYTELLTADDKPSWNYDNVTFYRPATKDWVRATRHLMFSRGASPDVLIHQDGTVFECTSGEIIWRGDHWWVCWFGYQNTRAAKMVRAGIHWWRYPEKDMPEGEK